MNKQILGQWKLTALLSPASFCSKMTSMEISKGGKSYQSKQEGDWWQQSQSPERFEDENSKLEAAFIERPTPGGYTVNQLRDNRSRHQFGERLVTTLSWNRAAMKRIGHICTTFRLETQTYVLVMRSLGDQVLPTVGY
jgi:hypothetical protein